MTKSYKNILKYLSFLGLFLAMSGIANADVLCPASLSCQKGGSLPGGYSCNWDKTNFERQSGIGSLTVGTYNFVAVNHGEAGYEKTPLCEYVNPQTKDLTYIFSNSKIVPDTKNTHWTKDQRGYYKCGDYVANQLKPQDCPMVKGS